MKDSKYIIIYKDEVDLIDFSSVLETNTNTLRWSIDGEKTFVKYNGDQPDFVFEDITDDLVGRKEYNHEEFLEILKTAEWTKSIH